MALSTKVSPTQKHYLRVNTMKGVNILLRCEYTRSEGVRASKDTEHQS